MRKKTITRKSRRALAVLCAVLFLGSAVGLAWSYSRPATVTEEYAAFAYEQEAEVRYRVHLMPNDLFPESVQPPGKAYITGLTDFISTDFFYRFAGERPTAITGAYGVTATLTAFTGTERQEVWTRSFDLLPTKSFSGNGGEAVVRETVHIPFAEYAAFAARVAEATKFNPDTLHLTVRYDVAVDAATDRGPLREELSPTLVIPVGGRTFTVGGSPTAGGPGQITQTRTTPRPQVERLRTGFAAATAFWAVALLTLLLATRGEKTAVNPAAQALERFLKTHGERVAVARGRVPLPDKVYTLNSLDDLVKAADELEKPILYHLAEDGRHTFLVLEGTYAYRHSLKTAAPLAAPGSLAKDLSAR